MEGQDFDYREILKRVKAQYNSLKGQSKESAFGSESKQAKKDTDKIRCYSCQRSGHVSNVCFSLKKCSECTKSASEWKERVKRSDGSNKLKTFDQSTELANVAAVPRDGLESIGDSFSVRIQSSVAKHGCGKAKVSTADASRGTNVHPYLDDFSDSRVLPRLDVDGVESGIDDHPGKVPIIPELQPPRYSIADSGASYHMTSSRHTLYNIQSSDRYSIRIANGDSREVQSVGQLDFSFLAQDESFVLTLDRVPFVKGLVSDLLSLRAMNKADHKFEWFGIPFR